MYENPMEMVPEGFVLEVALQHMRQTRQGIPIAARGRNAAVTEIDEKGSVKAKGRGRYGPTGNPSAANFFFFRLPP